jgi:hypothetical protein
MARKNRLSGKTVAYEAPGAVVAALLNLLPAQ